MHPKRNARRPLLWGLVLVAGLTAMVTRSNGQPMPPAPVAGDVVIDAKTGALLVPVGGLVAFDPRLPKDAMLTDIIVAREDILSVRLDPANPRRLLLTGKTAGLTQLTLVVKDQPKLVFDVIVQPDLNLLRALIKRTVPTAAVDVQPGIGNVIVLSGYVTTPQDADTISRLATSAVGNVNNVVNAVQVGGGQQVQIDVVVASVDRNLLRSRGFDFAFRGGSVNFSSLVSGLIGGQLAGAPTITADANLQLGVVPNQFFAALRALRSEGVAKFIAEPKVVTQTGRPAFFRAGGQQAILSGTSGITGPGVQLVPFGTELEVVPVVYGNGMIWLEINPRISAVSQALGISVGGSLSPGFTEQQVRAAVMLESGQTYAIGGLIQNSVQASATKVPILGEIPYFGTAFNRVQHEQRESELIILVTPRLVGPMNCDQVPKRMPGRETRNPDDYELFLESILEAPRGQRKVWNGRCYNAPWKCDPTACLFPCAGNVCTGPNCGVGGCGVGVGSCGVAPVGPRMTAPGTLPPVPVGPVGPGGALPHTLPPVPGAPVGGAESPISGPASPPPVIVIPEVPRN
jgi:pilus assembly protein CpaC